MPVRSEPDTRRDLAKIHIAKKELRLDDETYRQMLWTVARVHSAADLDQAGRKRVLEHMRSRGWNPRRGRPRPAQDRDQLVRKIRAQLTEAQRPDSYADSMASHMFGVARFEWCNPTQLRKIAAALTYDAKRHGRRER